MEEYSWYFLVVGYELCIFTYLTSGSMQVHSHPNASAEQNAESQRN